MRKPSQPLLAQDEQQKAEFELLELWRVKHSTNGGGNGNGNGASSSNRPFSPQQQPDGEIQVYRSRTTSKVFTVSINHTLSSSASSSTDPTTPTTPTTPNINSNSAESEGEPNLLTAISCKLAETRGGKEHMVYLLCNVRELRICRTCRKVLAPLKCSRCKCACYCDHWCQRKDYGKHTRICKAMGRKTSI